MSAGRADMELVTGQLATGEAYVVGWPFGGAA